MLVVSLYAVVAAGALLRVEGLPTAVRIPLALPLLIFAPGYALVTALFPRRPGSRSVAGESRGEEGLRTGMAPLERVTLGVVASIAIVPTMAVIANAVDGVYLAPVLAGVAAITVVASAVAVVRAPSGGVSTATSGDRFGPGDPESGRWRDTLTDGVTLVAITLTAMLLVSSAALAFTGDSGDSIRTEFYLADDAADGDGTVDLAVEHHGEDEQPYTVVVVAADSPAANGTAGSASELDRFSMDVGPDETASETYRVADADLGDDATLLFLLYRGNAPDAPGSGSAHRQLRSSVNETTG